MYLEGFRVETSLVLMHFQVTMNYCVKSVYFIVNITVLCVSAIVSKPYAFMVCGMKFVSQLHITC